MFLVDGFVWTSNISVVMVSVINLDMRPNPSCTNDTIHHVISMMIHVPDAMLCTCQ